MKPIVRDQQRRRVYAWEEAAVAPHDRTEITREVAEGMIAALWAELGLHYPPKVRPLPTQARGLFGRADRLTIELAPRFPAWVLLHELAHALTSSLEGVSDGHGPRFMAAYIHLLARFLRLAEADLRESARQAGLRIGIWP